jgi:biotin transport system substrate-specific component
LKLKTFELTLAATFAALTAVGAYIYIPLPFTPVPITMQTFFVYLSALILGGKLAALTQLIYLLLGALGLPVFAGGKAGFAVLLGPTGGYLLGFAVGAFLAGKIYEKGKNVLRSVLALLVATAAIYGLGIFQLWFTMNTVYGEGLGFLEAVFIGIFPFIFGDVAKMFLALGLAKTSHFTILKYRINSLRKEKFRG